MNPLLNRAELNYNVSREAFLTDIDCLFDVLQKAYGLYEYFGHEAFLKAKSEIADKLDNDAFAVEESVSILTEAFASFIKDGHFRIGPGEAAINDPGFAVRHTTLHGVPMIQCRKFYYDTPEEEQELVSFSESYPMYRNTDPLIIDLRDNPGGSDIYIWNFIKGLYGVEPDYPCIFVQKYSELIRQASGTDKQGTVTYESEGVIIKSQKPVYLWVNENTASSAESAVAYFKTAENVTIVGTHTAGCFSCGNCVTIYLPNTHLPVYFGTGMVLYEKTRNIDAEGGFITDLSDDAFLKRMCK